VAQDGIALAVRPAHTMGDGDTMFAIGTGEIEGDAPMDRLLAAVAAVTSRAIMSGVRAAVGLAGLPAVSELTEARRG
jgi:L-aminopeptidase/D-esterase-like protein